MSEAMDDDVIAEVCRSHLFSALEVDLALQRLLSLYLGKAKHDDAFAWIAVLRLDIHVWDVFI